jgi:hypothetical protein
MPRTILLAIALLAAPAFAQTTTTVTTDPQPAEQPPPPPPPAPSTQVVVNPSDPNAPAPPPRTRLRVADEAPAVETIPSGRGAVGIVATDALYGGIAGALIGGGVTLIDQGNFWQRDIMVGAGVGVLVGAAYGVYEAAVQPRTVVRAVADRNGAASDAIGPQMVAYGGRF